MALRNRRRGKVDLKDLVLGVLILLAATHSAWFQDKRFAHQEFRSGVYKQQIKLPPKEALKFVTLGYDNVYADWLWLQSIQNFGAGWVTENNVTEPISEYFDTLTDLDPQFISAYRFGNMILGENRHDYDAAQALIRKGIHLNPQDYDLPFLGLYSSIWETKDMEAARFYADRIRNIPDAPNYMKRMEEYIERKSGHLGAAFEINARYLLQYQSHNNDIEFAIMRRRIRSVLEQWYAQDLSEAVDKFVEANGDGPRRIEELMDARYLEPFEAPTMERLDLSLQLIEEDGRLPKNMDEVPDALVEEVVTNSTTRIVGLPPDPYGFWYLIYTPYREGFEKAPKQYEEFELPYLISGNDLKTRIDQITASAHAVILEHQNTNNGELPPAELMDKFIGPDQLGGHFEYDPSAANHREAFYSTGLRRALSKQDPRMGLWGPPPWKQLPSHMTLEPSLLDFPEEVRWGRAHGYITQDGRELRTREEVDENAALTEGPMIPFAPEGE